jgi:hypothetical protein
MKKPLPYLLPSIADLFFVIFLILFSSNMGGGLLNDGDTGFHIRAGEYILDTFSIPRQDIFSFLSPLPPWTAHEWLSEIVMAFAHMALGLTGVVIFFAFFISLTYYLLIKFLRKEHDNILLLAGMVLLVAISSYHHFFARPHIFSLLFLVIWYHILDQFQYKDRNHLYLLPIMTLVWVNLHGAFIIGFVLLGTYFTGNMIFYFQAQAGDMPAHGAKAKKLLVIGLFCLLAALVNPVGYKILLFPFDFVANQYLIAHVNEFLPTSFQKPLPYKCLFIITLAVLFMAKNRLNWIELILVLGFTYMSLYSVRNITLFAIIVAPIIVRRLDEMMQNSKNKAVLFLNAKSQSFAETDRTTRGYAWPVAACCVVLFLGAVGIIQHGFDPKKKPVEAVNFLENEPISGNMFNNDEFGDYLIYAAYPKYRVFFDGRSDMYGVDHMKEYFKVTGIQTGWKEVLKKFDIRWVFFNADSLLSRYLLEQPDWHLIYADKVAHIYVQDLPEYQYLIEKYPHVVPVKVEE